MLHNNPVEPPKQSDVSLAIGRLGQGAEDIVAKLRTLHTRLEPILTASEVAHQTPLKGVPASCPFVGTLNAISDILADGNCIIDTLNNQLAL